MRENTISRRSFPKKYIRHVVERLLYNRCGTDNFPSHSESCDVGVPKPSLKIFYFQVYLSAILYIVQRQREQSQAPAKQNVPIEAISQGRWRTEAAEIFVRHVLIQRVQQHDNTEKCYCY